MLKTLGRQKLLLAAASICTLAAGALLVLQASREGPAAVSVPMTAESARALGAEWRINRDKYLTRRYADALLATGQDELLIKEIAEEGLFADNQSTAQLYAAEAYLRLGNLEKAREIASRPDYAHNAYAAFLRARTEFAFGGAGDPGADLTIVLRARGAYAGEAWLLRAREALDANETDVAEAAARRAREAGAASSRADIIEIEAALRRGDLAGARSRLVDRAVEAEKRRRRDGSESVIDPEGERLRAMAALIAGDATEANRFVSRAGIAEAGDRSAPLAALVKWRAGDRAQAYALLQSHLDRAPGDWRAVDLALAFSRTLGRDDDVIEFKGRLLKLRPALAAFRDMRRAAERGDLDAQYLALMSAPADLSADKIEGSAASLLGAGAPPLDGLEEPDEFVRRLFALAFASKNGSAYEIGRAIDRLGDISEAPIASAVVAAAKTALGADVDAMKFANASAQQAPQFFAPVAIEAAILGKAGQSNEAIDALRDFANRNPERSDARRTLALALEQGGKFNEAAHLFAAMAPEIAFGDDETALAYARAAARAGDAGEAMERAQLAMMPIRRFALICEAVGANEEAARAWRDSLIAGSTDSDVIAGYQQAMERLGRGGEGRRFIAELERRKRPVQLADEKKEPEHQPKDDDRADF